MWIVTLLIFIFILSIIVLVHELGHFFWAKKFGVHIDEFSIGMGPKVWGKKGKDGIDYNIRAIPIGGFVAMAGEVYEEEGIDIPKDKFLCNKPWWQRAIVMIAGVVNNFILALLLIFLSTIFFKTVEPTLTIESVIPNSPVSNAGIKAGDTIVAVGGKEVSYLNEFNIRLIFESDKKSHVLTIEHENGKREDYKITPKEMTLEDGTKITYGFEYHQEKIDTLGKKISYTFRTFFDTFDTMNLTLYGLFTGKVSVSDLSGPVGIFELVDDSVTTDQSFVTNIQIIIYLIWLLSINVGYLNILPFPAFDGGRLLFIVIEKIKGSPVNEKFENICHTVGFILIMLLIVFVTINDIIKLF